jgi:hypothetical protein
MPLTAPRVMLLEMKRIRYSELKQVVIFRSIQRDDLIPEQLKRNQIEVYLACVAE